MNGIRKLRAMYGVKLGKEMSRREFAKELGVSFPTIINWELGRKPKDFEIIAKMIRMGKEVDMDYAEILQ